MTKGLEDPETGCWQTAGALATQHQM